MVTEVGPRATTKTGERVQSPHEQLTSKAQQLIEGYGQRFRLPTLLNTSSGMFAAYDRTISVPITDATNKPIGSAFLAQTMLKTTVLVLEHPERGRHITYTFGDLSQSEFDGSRAAEMQNIINAEKTARYLNTIESALNPFPPTM